MNYSPCFENDDFCFENTTRALGPCGYCGSGRSSSSPYQYALAPHYPAECCSDLCTARDTCRQPLGFRVPRSTLPGHFDLMRAKASHIKRRRAFMRSLRSLEREGERERERERQTESKLSTPCAAAAIQNPESWRALTV